MLVCYSYNYAALYRPSHMYTAIPCQGMRTVWYTCPAFIITYNYNILILQIYCIMYDVLYIIYYIYHDTLNTLIDKCVPACAFTDPPLPGPAPLPPHPGQAPPRAHPAGLPRANFKVGAGRRHPPKAQNIGKFSNEGGVRWQFIR